MARLTEEMVIARSKQSDLAAVKKLNCWGAELGDVTLIRRMHNVEVLALSINKIRTLEDFSWCRRLRELFIRKNDIRDLREIRHLRHLPLLTCLWLDENPCTDHPQYRMTVLRNLPNLEKLDNVPVNPDEVAEAMRRGDHIPDSDDEGYSQQEQYPTSRRRSCDSSPDRGRPTNEGSDGSEPGGEYPPEPPGHAQEPQYSTGPPSPTRQPPDVRSVNEYSYSNGDYVTSPGHYSDSQYNGDRTQDRPLSCRCESYQQLPPSREWERDREREGGRERERDRDYPSAVMAERRGFTRRPVARNSNLLSAVLCLVKELDYPSLEVAEMAVRCRMDELANSQ